MMAGTDPSEEDPSHLGERKRVGAETGMSIETGIGMTTAMTVIAVGVDLGHGRLAEMQADEGKLTIGEMTDDGPGQDLLSMTETTSVGKLLDELRDDLSICTLCITIQHSLYAT